MIVRILNEGQWRLADDQLGALNISDDAIESAVDAGDEAALRSALTSLLDQIRAVGEVVPDDSLADSDLILPDADATLDEVRAWLSDSDEGLIPGRG